MTSMCLSSKPVSEVSQYETPKIALELFAVRARDEAYLCKSCRSLNLRLVDFLTWRCWFAVTERSVTSAVEVTVRCVWLMKKSQSHKRQILRASLAHGEGAIA